MFSYNCLAKHVDKPVTSSRFSGQRRGLHRNLAEEMFLC